MITASAMSRRQLDFLKALLIAFLAATAAASPNSRKLDESSSGGDVKCGTCIQSPPPPDPVYPPPPPPLYSPPPPLYSPPPPPKHTPKQNCPPPPYQPSIYNPPPSQPSAYSPPANQPSTNIPGPPGGNLYPVEPLFTGAGRRVASGLAASIFMLVAVLATLFMNLEN